MGNRNFGEKTKQNIATEGMTHTVGFFCIAPSPIHPSIYYFSFLPPLMMSDIRFQATSNGDGDFADFSPSLAVLLSFFFPPCGPIGKSSLIDGTDAALTESHSPLGDMCGSRNRNERSWVAIQ